MTVDDTEVLVVGAGPTGLTLACDLLQRGIPTAIVEKRTEPSTTSRAFALHARGLEILEDVGAGAIVRSATAITGVTMHAAGHALVRMRFGGLARSGHPGAYLLSQADVEAALRDRLRELGGEVRFGHELVDATHDDRGVTATIRHPEQAGDPDDTERAAGPHQRSARWLIGCDGGHSVVRDLAAIPFEGGTLEESFLLADLEVDGSAESPLEPGEIAAFLHADGILGLFPLPEPGLWRLIAQRGDSEPLPDEPDEVAAAMEEVIRRRTGRDDVRVAHVRWSSRFRIHRRLARRYRTGRLLIAGDAAHVHSPFGGQGMNVGLGDATNLGWKLAEVARGRAGRRLLDSYERERRPVAEQVVGLTTSTTRFATGDHAPGRVVRDEVLPRLARARSGRATAALAPPRVLLERFAQLGVHYRAGPLAARARGGGEDGTMSGALASILPGPRPGDRAPDGPAIGHPPGTRTSLRSTTRARWALLRFGPPSPGHQDAVTAATRHLGEDVLLVRVLSSPALVAPERWLATATDGATDGRTTEGTTGSASGGTTGSASGGTTGEVLLEDHLGTLRRAYRPRGSESVLVRPDGHVGWRSGWPSVPLHRWLTEVLGGPSAP